MHMYVQLLSTSPWELATKVLSAVHLVAIVKKNIVSMYGVDSVLKPFVDDMSKLV